MLENISQTKVHDGWHKQYSHQSKSLHCLMRFAIYLPPQASSSQSVPAIYWLSGLTCTDENFMQKAGAFKKAAELGIAIICPDTSPRGEGVPDDPDGAYDLGLGAGFYLNATQSPWDKHYHMYSYILDELPALIEQHFPILAKKSIAGHSMGGHGALTIGLKNQDKYQSISAFSPICNPIYAPWGQKAFRHYLGEDKEQWRQYDTVELLKQHQCNRQILIDQGEADHFLTSQLMPQTLTPFAVMLGEKLQIRIHPGYDHSYYFIQSFIEQHLEFHAKYLLSPIDDKQY
jgi:S-formylglutathione hydrolase